MTQCLPDYSRLGLTTHPPLILSMQSSASKSLQACKASVRNIQYTSKPRAGPAIPSRLARSLQTSCSRLQTLRASASRPRRYTSSSLSTDTTSTDSDTVFADPHRPGLFYHLVPAPTPISASRPAFALSFLAEPPRAPDAPSVIGWLPAQTEEVDPPGGGGQTAALRDFRENGAYYPPRFALSSGALMGTSRGVPAAATRYDCAGAARRGGRGLGGCGDRAAGGVDAYPRCVFALCCVVLSCVFQAERRVCTVQTSGTCPRSTASVTRTTLSGACSCATARCCRRRMRRCRRTACAPRTACCSSRRGSRRAFSGGSLKIIGCRARAGVIYLARRCGLA